MHLLLPGLLWPRLALPDTVYGLDLPTLSLLLGKGRKAWGGAQESSAWLNCCIGIEPNIAAAPLRALGYGAEVGSENWLCLDPVHLQVGQRRVVLTDPASLALTETEALALVKALQPLLAAHGELICSSALDWHLRLEPESELATLAHSSLALASLTTSIGRSAETLLTDNKVWLRLLNEIQICLHQHPVNQARLETGKPQVNSLWPWGIGKLGTTTSRAASSIYGEGAQLQGRAKFLGTSLTPAPLQYRTECAKALVYLDSAAMPEQLMDAQAWRDVLEQLEQNWLSPALAALKRGEMDELRISANGEEATLTLCCTRSDLWRFWRKPQPLTGLAP